MSPQQPGAGAQINDDVARSDDVVECLLISGELVAVAEVSGVLDQLGT